MIFPKKLSLCNTLSMDKVSIETLFNTQISMDKGFLMSFFLFPRYQTECVMKLLFRQLMMS